MVETLSPSCKGEERDDGGPYLPLGDEEGEVERVGEDVVMDEFGEQRDEVEEGIGGPQRQS